MKLPKVWKRVSQHWIELVSIDHGQPSHVVLANQPRLVREMLRRVLEKTPGIRVIAEVASDSDLVGRLDEVLEQHRVDWVVTSITTQDALRGKPPWGESWLEASLLALSSTGEYAEVIKTAQDGTASTRAIKNLTLTDLLMLLRSKPTLLTH